MNHRTSLKKVRDMRTRKSIYLSMLLLSFHVVFVVYASSSYLSTWFSNRSISLLYATASLGTIILLFTLPFIISRFGNQRLMIFAICFELMALIGMAVGSGLDKITIAILFIAHNILVNLLFYNLDIFLEEKSNNEATGETRGIFLTASNIAFVITPTLSGLIIGFGGYPPVYVISAAFLLPLFAIVISQFENHKPKKGRNPLKMIKAFAGRANLRNIFIASFFLNFFYAWMTIYTPLYLSTILGFEWGTIGIIFSIMLLPFLLFELPLGKIADRYLGEKEIMATGFIILSLSTILLTFLPKSFFLWALFLFITRIGASAVEIMVETYFFKQIDSTNTEEIGFFRMSRPFGLLAAPLFAASTLFIFSSVGIPFGFSFIVLGTLCLFGTLPALFLKDTK